MAAPYGLRLQGVYTLRPLAAYTATQVITSQDALFSGVTIPADITAMSLFLNVTVAPGVETLNLQVTEQDPLTVLTSIPAANNLINTTATVATGLVTAHIQPGATNVNATITTQVLARQVPPWFRIRVLHSASGSWTYSLVAALYN